MPDNLQGVIENISNVPVKKLRWFERLSKRNPLLAMLFISWFALGWVTVKWQKDVAYHTNNEILLAKQVKDANSRADSAYWQSRQDVKQANERVEKSLDRQERINDQLIDRIKSLSK